MTDRQHATHRAETRPEKEVLSRKWNCTMLSVDGGFSIDIIFDHSL